MNARVHGALLACAALALLAATALAAPVTLLWSGKWEAFGGTTNDNTQTLCGVSTDQDRRYFSFKIWSHSGRLTRGFSVGGPEWKGIVTKGFETAIVVRVDANPGWSLRASENAFEDGDPGVMAHFDGGVLDDFLRQFRAGTRLDVRFGDARLGVWSYSLAGSAGAADAFAGCLRTLR